METEPVEGWLIPGKAAAGATTFSFVFCLFSGNGIKKCFHNCTSQNPLVMFMGSSGVYLKQD